MHKAHITVIAVSNSVESWIFRGEDKLASLTNFLIERDCFLTGHNFKFDMKMLHAAGLEIDQSRWVHDSQLLAFLYQDKIPEAWLTSYEETRAQLNKSRKGNKHRAASLHSLKTTAPYYLGVAPFWEAENHDNDEYVTKDADYTHKLTTFLISKLRQQSEKSYQFYKEKLLPWTKNLYEIEIEGIRFDKELLQNKWNDTEKKYLQLNLEIREQWKEQFDLYAKIQFEEVNRDYDAAEERSRNKGRWSEKIAAQYKRNREKAQSNIEGLNIDSPVQLKWLLKQIGLDAINLEGEESTDRETLNRLADEQPQVAKLLEYRRAKKLLTSFYPEYAAKAVNNRIHTNFNSTGARTGRLSSSQPNLQQVPGHLHDLFTASPGNALITRDLSAIEPTMLAYYTEDYQLCHLMLNNGDFHGSNAAVMFSLDCEPSEIKTTYAHLRKIAKTVGLAVLYGAGARRVHQTLITAGRTEFTLADCKQMVYRIRDFYNGVWEFKKTLDSELESGQILYNYLGRPIKIQNPEDVYMRGLNTLIQSSASDLLQQAALDIRNQGLAPRLLVHDELIVEVFEKMALEAEATVTNEMTKFKLPTQWGNIPIKTEGKIAKCWEK